MPTQTRIQIQKFKRWEKRSDPESSDSSEKEPEKSLDHRSEKSNPSHEKSSPSKTRNENGQASDSSKAGESDDDLSVDDDLSADEPTGDDKRPGSSPSLGKIESEVDGSIHRLRSVICYKKGSQLSILDFFGPYKAQQNDGLQTEDNPTGHETVGPVYDEQEGPFSDEGIIFNHRPTCFPKDGPDTHGLIHASNETGQHLDIGLNVEVREKNAVSSKAQDPLYTEKSLSKATIDKDNSSPVMIELSSTHHDKSFNIDPGGAMNQASLLLATQTLNEASLRLSDLLKLSENPNDNNISSKEMNLETYRRMDPNKISCKKLSDGAPAAIPPASEGIQLHTH